MIKVIVAVAAINIGTIVDTEKPISRDYWLKNAGEYGWKVSQVYTSCGCTTASFDEEKLVRQGDSICVTLTFNPEGRHGDFSQTGTVILTDGEERDKTILTIEGSVTRSEETIKRQFPYECGNGIRASVNKVDCGILTAGKQVSRYIALYNESSVKQTIAIGCKQPISASDTTVEIQPQESIAIKITYDADQEKMKGITENIVTIGTHNIRIIAKKR